MENTKLQIFVCEKNQKVKKSQWWLWDKNDGHSMI